MRYSLCILFSFLCLYSFGQTNPLVDSIKTRTLGPFDVTTFDSMRVYVKIDRLYWSKATKSPFSETDLSFAVINEKEQELLRRSYPYSSMSQIFITPTEFNIPGIGKTIFIRIEDYPSCCDDGDGQIYGTNQLGYFIAMTGLIRLGQKYSDGNYFKPKYIYRSKSDIIKNQKFEGSKLFLEKYEAGGGFEFLSIFEYNEFHPEGIMSDLYNSNHLNLEIIPINFNMEAYKIHRANEKDKESREILLYNFTKAGEVISKLVIYKTTSKLEVIEFRKFENEHWLHVRIDNIEGYVKMDDFEKMCFHAHS